MDSNLVDAVMHDTLAVRSLTIRTPEHIISVSTAFNDTKPVLTFPGDE